MKNTGKIAIILMLAVSLYFISCDAEGNGDDEGISYAIGDTGPSGVGKVFYITDGGLHGIEAAPSLWNGGSEDPYTQWKTDDSSTSGTSTAIGTGSANTALMITVSHPPADLCRAYNGGGKNDWFLPSKDELYQLYLHKDIVGDLTAKAYWSSSESDTQSAWFQYSESGQSNTNKKEMLSVRAVRAF